MLPGCGFGRVCHWLGQCLFVSPWIQAKSSFAQFIENAYERNI